MTLVPQFIAFTYFLIHLCIEHSHECRALRLFDLTHRLFVDLIGEMFGCSRWLHEDLYALADVNNDWSYQPLLCRSSSESASSNGRRSGDAGRTCSRIRSTHDAE
jgi:hypothetical protein